MNIASGILLALMTIDIAYPVPFVEPPKEDSVYTTSGVGELSVIALSEPMLGSVPRGAQRIPFLTLNLSASCDKDITLDALTLRHAGLGLSTDISSVYVFQHKRRVTRSGTFNQHTNEVILRFRGFVIPKCSAIELSIVGNMSPDSTVASEHLVVLTGAKGIVSSAKKITVSTEDSSKRVIASPMQAGSITARFLRISGRPSYGHVETVARLQLTADSKNAHLLKKITLTNQGSARDMDLQWLSFETLSGKKITTSAARMHGYTAAMEFNPTYVLHAGETIVLNLKAEIRGSQTKTIDFHLEEESDLVALPYRDR